jgi:hypothetical protein
LHSEVIYDPVFFNLLHSLLNQGSIFRSEKSQDETELVAKETSNCDGIIFLFLKTLNPDFTVAIGLVIKPFETVDVGVPD